MADSPLVIGASLWRRNVLPASLDTTSVQAADFVMLRCLRRISLTISSNYALASVPALASTGMNVCALLSCSHRRASGSRCAMSIASLRDNLRSRMIESTAASSLAWPISFAHAKSLSHSCSVAIHQQPTPRAPARIGRVVEIGIRESASVIIESLNAQATSRHPCRPGHEMPGRCPMDYN